MNRFAAFGVVAFSLAAIHSALPQSYTITDLGALSPGSGSQGKGINNFGQVVGTAGNGESYTLRYCQWQCNDFACNTRKWTCDNVLRAKERAFLWTPSRAGAGSGTMIDLGTFGGPSANAISVSQFGHVIGHANTQHRMTYGGRDVEYSYESYQSEEFLWTPAAPNGNQGSMSGVDLLLAVGVNSAGQVVGGNVVWQSGIITGLGAINARSVNDLGQIVGGSPDPGSGQSHALLWQQGVISDLGSLPGYTNSDAYGINTNGQIVGVAWNEAECCYGPKYRGFLFGIDSSGTVTGRTDLGMLPDSDFVKPLSVNNRGEVVGITYSRSYGRQGAFLWDGAHGMRDLHLLILPDAGWELFEASGINDRGQIAASLTRGYLEYRAVLLTPIFATRLSTPTIQFNGQFRFTLIGEPSHTYTIQASTNLVNWTDLTNFISVSGTDQFTDSTAPSFNRRFYRAVTP